MAGSPIKHERNRLIREAILRGAVEGTDPVEYLLPYTDKLKKMALEGDAESPATLGALKEIFDRVDGKPSQEVISEDTGQRKLVDAALLGAASELLKRIPAPRKVVEEKVIGGGSTED